MPKSTFKHADEEPTQAPVDAVPTPPAATEEAPVEERRLTFAERRALPLPSRFRRRYFATGGR